MPTTENQRRTAPLARLAAVALAALLAVPLSVVAAEAAAGTPDPAASTEEEGEQRGRSRAEPDFLFGSPRGSVGVRGGVTFSRAGSDIYTFTEEQFTVEDSDFRAGTFGVDVGWFLSPRLQALFGVEYNRTSPVSEYRDFVDAFGAPIVQETRLEEAPVTASLKVFLTERGRAVGRHAWVPAKVAPYVGGGGGFVWYRFQQFGDFVDFVDLAIFSDRFVSEGWATAVQAFGGAEINLTPRLALGLEGRYLWADDELGLDFVGFEPIDLSGLRATVGLSYYF